MVTKMRPEKLHGFTMFHCLSHGEHHIIESSARMDPHQLHCSKLLQLEGLNGLYNRAEAKIQLKEFELSEVNV